MSAQHPLRPPLGWLQAGALTVLVAERAVHALEPALTWPAYALLLAALGLWMTWPLAARHRAASRTALAAAGAPLFAGVGLAWRAAWARVATALPTALADWGPWILVALVLLLDLSAVRRVLRLTRIEALKLARSRLVRLGLLATVGLTLTAGLLHERLPSETGWTLATVMLGAGFSAAQVFLLVLGATAIAGEASQGTLKMILPHAYRRSDWVLAKALALALGALVYATVVSAAAVGATLALNARAPAAAAGRAGSGSAFGDVLLTAEGFGGDPIVTVHTTAAAMRAHLGDTLVAQVGALLGTLALGLLISCWLTNVVGALSTAFLAFAALKLGDLVLALDQETLRRLFTWAPERLREVTGKLGQGLSSEGWDERLTSVSLLLSAASTSAFLLLGTRVLARKDLHV